MKQQLELNNLLTPVQDAALDDLIDIFIDNYFHEKYGVTSDDLAPYVKPTENS